MKLYKQTSKNGERIKQRDMVPIRKKEERLQEINNGQKELRPA
jgi:hypothetical protein